MPELWICDAIRTPISRYGGEIELNHSLGMSGAGL